MDEKNFSKYALVGFTGFVGSNLYDSGVFDAAYNTKNIQDAYGTFPELLVYAGLRAEKYVANAEPERDREQIIQAEENIKKIAPKKLVLISTIDVFKKAYGIDERSAVVMDGLCAYGYHRYQLELWVREHYPDALIVRLPGLFGKNMKKNFIYDYIHVIPSMIKQERFKKLSEIDRTLDSYYTALENGFYKVKNLTEADRAILKKKFEALGFHALHFTDSRSKYQFYNLSRLWKDIQTALKHHLTLWHPAVEPVSAAELYKYLSGKEFVNELSGFPAQYDFRTVYANIFGGSGGYICGKEQVLCEIMQFVKEY